MDSQSRLLVVVVAATAACLPRGNPPAGRQLIADSTASLGAMVPPNGDGVLRVLFMRPSVQDSTGSDLFVVSVDADGQQSPERLLVSNIDTEVNLGCTWKVAPCSFDSKGRAFVYPNLTNQTPQPGQAPIEPLWVDPITGDVEQADLFGTMHGYTSDSGQRSFFIDYPDRTTGRVVEADGRTTELQLAPPTGQFNPYARWVGEDLYYVDAQRDLIDLPPSLVPQQLATDIEDFTVWSAPDGVLVVLTRATADPMIQQMSIRDPATAQEIPLPFDGNGSIEFSPDWQWLFYFEYSAFGDTPNANYTLFNVHSGATQVLDFGSSYVNAQWRPGHNELWAGVVDDGTVAMPRFWVVTPGGPTVTVEGVFLQGFSPDGPYFFTTYHGNVTAPTLEIGQADDPTGPRVPFNPPGTSFQELSVLLPDGRFLEAVYAKDGQRADVIALDPLTGASQLLAERGRIAALGKTQFIGMFHFQGGRGDLTVVNLASGQSTVLAPEFTVTAFAEPQGTTGQPETLGGFPPTSPLATVQPSTGDLVAPGTRIVYQYQARTPSPYDGIWLVNAP